MKKWGITGVIAVALMLGGCASEEPAPAPTVTVTAEPETAVTETPAPLEASTPTPEASEDDTTYLTEVRLRLQTLPDATDEQLLAAAETSCGLYGQGQGKFDQRLIEGETADPSGVYADSTAIATWAAMIYCPEFA